jgi:hypothetical protein
VLSLARVTLPTLRTLPVHVISVGEVFAVESGAAAIDLVAGHVAMSPRSGASVAIVRPVGGPVQSPVIAGGGSGSLMPGAVAGIRSLGDEPLVLLVLSLETGSDGS